MTSLPADLAQPPAAVKQQKQQTPQQNSGQVQAAPAAAAAAVNACGRYQQQQPSAAGVVERAALLRAMGSSCGRSEHSGVAAGSTAAAAAAGYQHCQQEQHPALLQRIHLLHQRQASQHGVAAAAAAGHTNKQEHNSALLQRLQVLQQRQTSNQQDTLKATAAATGSTCQQEQYAASLQTMQVLQPQQAAAAEAAAGSTDEQRPALLQRWQALQQRQARQQQAAGGVAAAATAGAASAAASGCEQNEQTAVLQRLYLLQQRQANAAAGDYREVCSDALDSPSDFVLHMKQLLATECFAEVQSEDEELNSETSCPEDEVHLEHAAAHCEDVDMTCGESTQGEDSALFGEAPALVGVADCCGKGDASPMCACPADNCEAATAAADVQPPLVDLQQQQRPQEEPAAAAATAAPDVPGHLRHLLVLASRHLSVELYSEARQQARAALTAAAAAAAAVKHAGSSLSSFCRDAERVVAMAVVLEHVQHQQWLAALQLPPHTSAAATAATEASHTVAAAAAVDVKRAYRRLAGLIHPDKCQHPSAEAAFKALTTAYQQALFQVTAPAAAAGGVHVDSWDEAEFRGAEGPESNDLTDGHAWWTEWEQDVADGQLDGAAAAGGAWGANRASQPTAVDEEEVLWRLSMQELAAEVERRQAGVLQPQCPEDAARPPVLRQKRLRVARTVLSTRMQQQRAVNTTLGVSYVDGNVAAVAAALYPVAGGFLARRSESIDNDWGEWKRQRQ